MAAKHGLGRIGILTAVSQEGSNPFICRKGNEIYFFHYFAIGDEDLEDFDDKELVIYE